MTYGSRKNSSSTSGPTAKASSLVVIETFFLVLIKKLHGSALLLKKVLGLTLNHKTVICHVHCECAVNRKGDFSCNVVIGDTYSVIKKSTTAGQHRLSNYHFDIIKYQI